MKYYQVFFYLRVVIVEEIDTEPLKGEKGKTASAYKQICSNVVKLNQSSPKQKKSWEVRQERL